jgi:hypothetical protein
MSSSKLAQNRYVVHKNEIIISVAAFSYGISIVATSYNCKKEIKSPKRNDIITSIVFGHYTVFAFLDNYLTC